MTSGDRDGPFESAIRSTYGGGSPLSSAVRVHLAVHLEMYEAGQRPGATRPDSYARTTNWARSRAPSLVRMRETWVFTVA